MPGYLRELSHHKLAQSISAHLFIKNSMLENIYRLVNDQKKNLH